MSRPVLIILGLLTFVLFAWWSLSHHRFEIEASIEDRTRETVENAGFEAVAVRADGRDITLSGEVLDARRRVAVENLAQEIAGVRVVNNRIAVSSTGTLAEPLAFAPYRISIAARADSIYLSGIVDTSAERDWLEAELNRRFPDVPVQNSLETGAGEFEPAHALIELGITSLTEMISGTVDVDSRGMRINGGVISEQLRVEMEESIAALDGQYDYLKVDSALVVQAPVEDVVVETVVLVAEPNEVLDTGSCQQELNGLIESEKILFENEKTTVNPESYALLDGLAAVAQRCSADIEIGGHTDSRGEDIYNQYLSEQRARAVRKYLVDAGISELRLTAVGYGATQPIDSNETRAQRANNRRIEFRVSENQQ